jgi:hypothetical protein
MELASLFQERLSSYPSHTLTLFLYLDESLFTEVVHRTKLHSQMPHDAIRRSKMEMKERQGVVRHVRLPSIELERPQSHIHNHWLAFFAFHTGLVKAPEKVNILGDTSLQLIECRFVVFEEDIFSYTKSKKEELRGVAT